MCSYTVRSSRPGCPQRARRCRVGRAASEGLVLVLPAAEGGKAQDVVVMLPTEAMARICRDPEVLTENGYDGEWLRQ